jgi:hypothetical protein
MGKANAFIYLFSAFLFVAPGFTGGNHGVAKGGRRQRAVTLGRGVHGLVCFLAVFHPRVRF